MSAPRAKRRSPPAKRRPKAAGARRTTPVLAALAAVAGVFACAAVLSMLLDDAPDLAASPAGPPGAAPAVVASPVTVPPHRPAVPAPPPAAAPPQTAAPPATPPAPPPPTSPVAEPPSVQNLPTGTPSYVPPAGREAPATETAALPVPPPPPSPGGTAPWLRHAVPAPDLQGRPAIAIVIDDLGVDRKRSARIVALPGPLTLAWLPYAQDLPRQTAAARAAGHELLVHMPMEPSVKADPGPGALLVGLAREERASRLARALDAFDGYVGINNHMGSRFTADREAMAPVLAELARRGLLWLDSRTTPDSAGPSLARSLDLPFAERDVFIDNTQTVAAVQGQLARAEAVARAHGFAIAIGHPHDATAAALAGWLPEVQRRGFVLVPVSTVVRARCSCG